MAQEFSVYQTLQREVVRCYYAIPTADLDTHVFNDFFIEATATLAGYGDQNQAANASLCARALLSRPTDNRTKILQAYEFPGRVHMQMVAPDDWPEFPEVQPLVSTEVE